MSDFGVFMVRGYDLYGDSIEEMIFVPPKLYFWLGADAYPEWPTISGIYLGEVEDAD